jgi:hypothetical protein
VVFSAFEISLWNIVNLYMHNISRVPPSAFLKISIDSVTSTSLSSSINHNTSVTPLFPLYWPAKSTVRSSRFRHPSIWTEVCFLIQIILGLPGQRSPGPLEPPAIFWFPAGSSHSSLCRVHYALCAKKICLMKFNWFIQGRFSERG